MIDLRDRRRVLTELLIAELLARPGQPGPLARPLWPRRGSPRPVVPKPPAAARPPESERR